MFDSNILLTKFGPGFWSRVPGFIPSPYSESRNKLLKITLLEECSDPGLSSWLQVSSTDNNAEEHTKKNLFRPVAILISSKTYIYNEDSCVSLIRFTTGPSG